MSAPGPLRTNHLAKWFKSKFSVIKQVFFKHHERGRSQWSQSSSPGLMRTSKEESVRPRDHHDRIGIKSKQDDDEEIHIVETEGPPFETNNQNQTIAETIVQEGNQEET